MASRQPPKLHCADDGAPLLERNRYFTGKFMTARDFQGEQDYLRSRHHLHNRLFHGWGIVSGLEVLPNPVEECRNSTVVVKAGSALDCCGREVILADDIVFEVPRPAISGSPSTSRPDPHESNAPRVELLLCVYYDEDEIELTPTLYDDRGSDVDAEQANRIRERATLRVLRLDQVKDSCWSGGTQHQHGGEAADYAVSSLEAKCPCGSGIPLALLSFNPDLPETALAIDGRGRRRVAVSADHLTHIVKTNWRHGETMSLSHLREKLGGRLEIHFDRKIQPVTENLGAGISEYTFIAQFGGVQDDLRPLPYAQDQPPFLEGDSVAVFVIDPGYLETNRRDDFRNKVIYVSLKCDFILDSRGMPVDGSHLGGVLPTRGGKMGGTFESWFSIAEAEGREPEPSSKRSRPRRGVDQ